MLKVKADAGPGICRVVLNGELDMETVVLLQKVVRKEDELGSGGGVPAKVRSHGKCDQFRNCLGKQRCADWQPEPRFQMPAKRITIRLD